MSSIEVMRLPKARKSFSARLAALESYPQELQNVILTLGSIGDSS